MHGSLYNSLDKRCTNTAVSYKGESYIFTARLDLPSGELFVLENFGEGGKVKQFSADEGKYLVAIALTDALTSYTDHLVGTVTPFAVDENGREYYGTTYTVTIVDGNIKGFTAYN